MPIEFSKYHGLGNDFILVYDQPVAAERAVQMCNRHTGVGGDGVIVLTPATGADFKFLLYNNDGGIAEVSGNGLRCAGKFLYEKGYHRAETVTLEAGGEVKVLRLSVDGSAVTSVRVDMGVAEDLGEIELHGYRWRKILTGNPHAVTFVEDLDEAPVTELGPLIENDPAFPDRTNVEFVKVDGDVVHARFWERGVGVTQACGSGACASLVATGLESATVRMLGGDLLIEKQDDGRIFMTGPAVHVFDGRTV